MGRTLPYLYGSLQAGMEAPEDDAVFVLSKVVSGSLLCMQHLQLVGGSGLDSSTELRMEAFHDIGTLLWRSRTGSSGCQAFISI